MSNNEGGFQHVNIRPIPTRGKVKNGVIRTASGAGEKNIRRVGTESQITPDGFKLFRQF